MKSNQIAKITGLSFERKYLDGSGVEFGVRLSHDEIVFEHIQVVGFPIDQLDWLIACLAKIREEIPSE